MGFGVIRRELHRGASLAERTFRVLPGGEGVSKIDVRLHKIRLQLHRHSEFRDCLIQLAGRQQDPAQGVVTFRSIRRPSHHFFEGRPRSREIALLQQTDALLIDLIDRWLVGRFLRPRGQNERHEQKHDLRNSNSRGRHRSQESARNGEVSRTLRKSYYVGVARRPPPGISRTARLDPFCDAP